MEAVVVIVFIIVIVFICLIAFSDGEIFDWFSDLPGSIKEARYERYLKKFGKAKQKKNFYKQVRYLKKLLNNNSCVTTFKESLITFKTNGYKVWGAWESDRVIPMWDIASAHHRLFNAKEQKAIDTISQALEEALRKEEQKKELAREEARKHQEELRQRAQTKQNAK